MYKKGGFFMDLENQSVLFVDDEANILRSLERGMMDEEFECFFANSGEEAIEVLEQENGNISVIISDMRMPGMDGLQLLKIVKQRWPKTVRIILSGYAQLAQVIATVNQADIFRFILKPWKMDEEFMGTIKAALEYNKLQVEKELLEESLKKQNQVYINMAKQMQKLSTITKQDASKKDAVLDIAFKNLIEKSEKDNSIFNNNIRMKMSYIIMHSISNISFEDLTEKTFSAFLKDVHLKLSQNNMKITDDINFEIEGKGKTNYKLIQSLIEDLKILLSFDAENKITEISLNKQTNNSQTAILLKISVNTVDFSSNEKKKEFVLTNIEVLNPLFKNILKFINGKFECSIDSNSITSIFKIPIID